MCTANWQNRLLKWAEWGGEGLVTKQLFGGLAAVGKCQIQIITTLRLLVIGKYSLVLDRTSLTTVLSTFVNVIMPELHNRSIFTKCFCSLVCMCWGVGDDGGGETDGGVRFGEGCGRKAGWQAGACLDSFSVPYQWNDKEGAGWGLSVCGGGTEPGNSVLRANCSHLPQQYCSVRRRQGQKKERQMMQRWELGAPITFHMFSSLLQLHRWHHWLRVRRTSGIPNKSTQASCKLNSVKN